MLEALPGFSPHVARRGDIYLQNWGPTASHFCCLGHLWPQQSPLWDLYDQGPTLGLHLLPHRCTP